MGLHEEIHDPWYDASIEPTTSMATAVDRPHRAGSGSRPRLIGPMGPELNRPMVMAVIATAFFVGFLIVLVFFASPSGSSAAAPIGTQSSTTSPNPTTPHSTGPHSTGPDSTGPGSTGSSVTTAPPVAVPPRTPANPVDVRRQTTVPVVVSEDGDPDEGEVCGARVDGDWDNDSIPNPWDPEPCVPNHVSAASPCLSYNGAPYQDPTGDWDFDGLPNEADPDPCMTYSATEWVGGDGAGPDSIDPGGLDPHDSNDPIVIEQVPPPSCDVYADDDPDHDGIANRWDFDPCVPTPIDPNDPCAAYTGMPFEDPFGDWDRDGVNNQGDTEPCNPLVADSNGQGGSCDVSPDGLGDGDDDGIPDRWDYDPCVPDHVSVVHPCDSYNGQPSEDPTGDWDRDGTANQSDPAACDLEIF